MVPAFVACRYPQAMANAARDIVGTHRLPGGGFPPPALASFRARLYI
jgi:hypothetical protein